MVDQEPPAQPKDIVSQALDTLQSEQLMAAFSQKTHLERSQFLAGISQSLTRLEKRQKELRIQEERALRETHGLNVASVEYDHPELAIQRIFRGDGKYLDFDRVNPDLLQGRVKQEMIGLLSLYKNHTTDFGKQSVAHLCPSLSAFTDLTENGVYIRRSEHNEPELEVINTIEELREILTTEGVNIVTGKTRKRTHYYQAANTRESALKEKLANWDTIVEDPPAPQPRP